MQIDKKLITLEKANNWAATVDFLEKNLTEVSQNLNASIVAIYFMMNLLVECNPEDQGIDSDKLMNLLKSCFNQSFQTFKENPEYLFFVGITACMSEWYLGMQDIHEAKNMLKKALEMDPENLLYNWGYNAYHSYRDINSDKKEIKANHFSESILNQESIKDYLYSKGELGIYIYTIIKHRYERINKS